MKADKGKIRLDILFLILLAIFTACRPSGETVHVKKGVLDLRNLDKIHVFSTTMSGEWEFYYNRFLNPQDSNETYVPDCYSSVPSYWTKTKNCPEKIKGTGYCSYRCIVLLPPGFHNLLGFDMPAFDTSYEMLINGKLVAFNGKPGKDKYNSKPASSPLFIKYPPKSDTLDIVIKVSNYEVSKGGFWMPMRIGSYNIIQRDFSNQWIISIATSSALLCFFIFFFIFYIINRKDLKILAFSLLTFSLSVIPVVSAPYLITLFTPLYWSAVVRIKYFNLFLLAFSGAWFTHFLYPGRISKKFSVFLTIISGVLSILIFTTPTLFFTHFTIVIQFAAALIIGYGLIMSLRGAFRKRLPDIIYLTAMIFMAYGIISDIKLANGLSREQHVYIMSFTMLFCVFLESVVLIKEWIQNAREKEKLFTQLEELTKTLEEKVNERTRELSRKTAETESQNSKIIEQNKKLSNIIHVKNEIFAVISHDLRSPIVNILYGLNLLKEEKNDAAKEQLTDSCIQSSQMVINLLENMLVWGRGQEDMIHFSPDYYNIADIIEKNISIFKENAGRKNISLIFNKPVESNGWFDKDLMDIIIRNLLSNAIKFTNHDGEVNIILEHSKSPATNLIIKVSDNGIGIPSDKIEQIFSGKGIYSTYGTDNEKGTGIGLKLVFDLVKISMGEITVESSQGHGTTFTIVLPDSDKIKEIKNFPGFQSTK